jgi:hypothetical protein
MISFIAQAVCSAVSACLAMSARISAGQLGVSIGQYLFEKMTGEAAALAAGTTADRRIFVIEL